MGVLHFMFADGNAHCGIAAELAVSMETSPGAEAGAVPGRS